MGVQPAYHVLLSLLEPDLCVPMVIDADGLSALTQFDIMPPLHDQVVLTPHPGEMARLLGTDTASVVDNPVSAARQLANESKAIVVLKMATSLIAHPDGRLCYNTTGNAGMASGGSGDVLCGMIAALLARGMDAYDACCCAVFLHGLSGDFAAEQMGMESMGSSDVAAMIPSAYRSLDAF